MSVQATSLRQLRSRLILILVVYFFTGTVSQKLIPGVDEVFPFFGWSLFSRTPNEGRRYTILIEEHNGQKIDPPVVFLQAPDSIVTGNRYIGRKVIGRLGRATKRDHKKQVKRYRKVLESNYLQGQVRYELIFERYDPIEKWETGESIEFVSLAHFATGESK